MPRVTISCGHVCNSQAFARPSESAEIVGDSVFDTLDDTLEGTVKKAATVLSNNVTKWLAFNLMHAYMILTIFQ